MAKLVSSTYGDALFELAVEENRVDAFYEEAEAVLTVISENEELSRLMNHPQIVKEEKLQLVDELFKGKVSEEMVGLIRMIITKDHFCEAASVFTYFLEKVKEYKNIGVAYVAAAKGLSDAQRTKVEERLLETTNYTSLEMHYEEDASLIGGMVIRIGDRVVDSSIRTKLYRLSKELYHIPLGMTE